MSFIKTKNGTKIETTTFSEGSDYVAGVNSTRYRRTTWDRVSDLFSEWWGLILVCAVIVGLLIGTVARVRSEIAAESECLSAGYSEIRGYYGNWYCVVRRDNSDIVVSLDELRAARGVR